MKLLFNCGCFMVPFPGVDGLQRMGVACCQEHNKDGVCVLGGQVLDAVEEAAVDEQEYSTAEGTPIQ